MFGLTSTDFKILMNVIFTHEHELERVILFGSRARGDQQAHSDIDLAILYKKNKQNLANTLQGDFALSALPYKVDLIDLNNESHTKLNDFIQKEGVILYDAQKNIGNDFMSLAALHEKLSDFQSALSRLTEALSVDITTNSLFLDGIIQRFEFTYELCWKLMKAYLRHLGVEANNPRDTFRESFKQHLILEKEAHRWFDMIDKRNLTTHTYHEKNALQVYAAVKNDYISLLKSFEKIISPLIQNI